MISALPVSAKREKIKVAFFAEILTPDLDGAIRTMYQLINRIDRLRFEFLFIYGAGPQRIAGFQSLTVPAVSLFINAGYSLALPALSQKTLTDTLNTFVPDVVHIATPSLLGKFGLNYAVQLQLPVITIYHTHFISYVNYYFKYLPFLIDGTKQFITQNHKSFYNKCSKVYVPSTAICTELQKMGIDTERMQIWKRGIDTTLFSPAKKDKAVLHKLTGNNQPTILFASRMVWEKNLETLFLIYDELQKASCQTNMVIAGDGSALKACMARMPNAIFTGKISHHKLAVLYASADVFLFPSVSEAYGNVVLEAMASGLPCVIADGGGSADFITQGINGFKCSPYDAVDYSDKITLVLQNVVLRKQMIAEGLGYSNAFSWDELAETYFNDVESLALQPRTQMGLAG